MSSNDPPVIRSGAAFKVEVSPGSLNAGGKKNGIRAGEVSGQHRDLTFDFVNENSADELLNPVAGEPTPDVFILPESSSVEDRLLNAWGPDLDSSAEKGSSEERPVAHKVILESDPTQSRSLSIEGDRVLQNEIKLPLDQSQDTVASFGPGDGGPNRAKLGFESADNNRAKILVKQDSTSVELVDVKGLKDNRVPIERDDTGAHFETLESSAEGPHTERFETESSAPNLAKFSEANDPTLKVKMDSEAHSDRLDRVAHEPILASRVTLQGEPEEANIQRLPSQRAPDNVQVIPPSEDRSNAKSTERENLLSKLAPLTEQVLASVANTGQLPKSLAEGPSEQTSFVELPSAPKAPQSLSAESPPTSSPSTGVSQKRAQLLELQQALILEKQRKADIYSGRVDAIRRSIAHVNARLDQVENTPKVVVE
jgi:hypothetical protein